MFNESQEQSALKYLGYYWIFLWIVFTHCCVATGHDACTAVCLSVESIYSLCLDVFNTPVNERMMSRRVAINWGEREQTRLTTAQNKLNTEGEKTHSHISGIEAALIWLLEREKYSSVYNSDEQLECILWSEVQAYTFSADSDSVSSSYVHSSLSSVTGWTHVIMHWQTRTHQDMYSGSLKHWRQCTFIK